MQQQEPITKQRPRPVVGVPACRKLLDPHWFHIVGEKYLDAIIDVAGCLPVVIPAIGNRIDVTAALRWVDGLLLTGSPSNVEPVHYGGKASADGTAHDPSRDSTTLPFVRAALTAGVPVLAICRGFQEMNVALGGSLDAAVHERAGALDHRDSEQGTLDDRYGPAHDIEVCEGGVLAALTGSRRLRVNSLHEQGIDRLADGVTVEAVAEDGLVEAFTVPGTAAFNLAVQWHPEYRASDNPTSTALFRAFGDAARRRQAARKPEAR